MKILHYPNPRLIHATLRQETFGIELSIYLDAMLECMKTHNGIGLAANQVGLDGSYFIFEAESGEIYDIINPIITGVSGQATMLEGCLSVPNIFVPIERFASVTLRYQDRHSTLHTKLFQGRDARVILHEMDHLSGIVYFERLNRKDRKKLLAQLKK